MTRLILFFLAFASGGMLYAQKAPVKFGKPSMEEMTKQVYEIDTSAPAVILCNYGYFDNSQFLFSHIIRVKILKKEGVKWGDWTFNTGKETSVRGRTYNLVDGKIVVDKLSSKSVKRQQVVKDYYYLTKISMPNVKVGSVIDIEVKYPYLPFRWYFQETIPVLHSELIIEKNRYISYNKNYFGYVLFSVNKPERWVTINVPAFQPEPYMAPMQNYIAHFELDISKIEIPGQLIYTFANTWKSVADKLYESGLFGGALSSSGTFFGNEAKLINANHVTETEKVKAALEFVHQVRWNGEKRFFLPTNSGLKYFFNKGEGSNAVINLSLIRLLQKLNIKTYPVILRTRDQGRIAEYSPTLRNLNYVMAYAKIDGKDYLIDGTDPLAPFYIIPEYTMNFKGRIIGKDTNNWIALTNNIPYGEKEFFMLSLDGENLSLKGNMSVIYNGYAAYELRKKQANNQNTGEHENSLKNRIEGLEIIKDTLMNLEDVYKPVKEKAAINIHNQCFEIDSLLYLSVYPERLSENPFKLEKRKYPVDFIYPLEYKTTVIITLPENTEVVSVPKSVKLKLPDNDDVFVYMIQNQGNKIVINRQLKINKSFFSQTKYDVLKSIYKQIIEKEGEQVVLRKL